MWGYVWRSVADAITDNHNDSQGGAQFRRSSRDDRRKTIASACQRRGKPGDELDQIGLPSNAGFFKQAAEVSFDGGDCKTPKAAATSGTPPISTMASSTRSSVG